MKTQNHTAANTHAYVTANLSAKVDNATDKAFVTVIGGRKSSVNRFLVTLPNNISTLSAAQTTKKGEEARACVRRMR